MSQSQLLADLIASSVATNGMITVGDTQPFDQVRLYQNPANDTVLTNQSTDGMVDASTTALVITGNTAPTGLVFKPNLGVLRNVTSDIKFMVDSAVDLSLAVDLGGSSTAFSIQAGKTAVLTIGLIAGVPMIVGSHHFFDLATGEAITSGLFAVLTNATHDNNLLHYTGGQIMPDVGGMSGRVDQPNGRSLNLVVPALDVLVDTSVAVVLGPYATAADFYTQMFNGNATTTLSISAFNGQIYAQLQCDGSAVVVIPNVQSGDVLQVDFNSNELSVMFDGVRYSDGPSSRIVPSDPLYALVVVGQNGDGSVPDLLVSEHFNVMY